MTTEAPRQFEADSSLVEFPAPLARAVARSLEDRRGHPLSGWMWLLLFVLPFAAVALIVRPSDLSEAQRLLLDRARLSDGWLSYQPLPTLIARVGPSTVWLVAVAAVAAGVTLRMLARVLLARGFARPLIYLLLAAMLAAPGIHILVFGDLTSLLLLAMTLLALGGLQRFSEERVTADGFVAGIALGAAVLIHPAALWLVAIGSTLLFTVTWTQRRHLGDAASAAWAAVTVIAFPSFVAILGVACVGWASGHELHTTPVAGMSVPDVSLLGDALRQIGAALLVTPLYLVGLAIVGAGLLQRPVTAGVYALPLLMLVAAGAVGIEVPREFVEALLLGTALLFVRPALFVGQIDLALIAVLQIAVGVARASGQV